MCGTRAAVVLVSREGCCNRPLNAPVKRTERDSSAPHHLALTFGTSRNRCFHALLWDALLCALLLLRLINERTTFPHQPKLSHCLRSASPTIIIIIISASGNIDTRRVETSVELSPQLLLLLLLLLCSYACVPRYPLMLRACVCLFAHAEQGQLRAPNCCGLTLLSRTVCRTISSH